MQQRLEHVCIGVISINRYLHMNEGNWTIFWYHKSSGFRCLSICSLSSVDQRVSFGCMQVNRLCGEQKRQKALVENCNLQLQTSFLRVKLLITLPSIQRRKSWPRRPLSRPRLQRLSRHQTRSRLALRLVLESSSSLQLFSIPLWNVKRKSEWTWLISTSVYRLMSEAVCMYL